MRRALMMAVAAVLVAAGAAGLQARRQDAVRAALTAEAAPPDAIWLDGLDLSRMVQRRQTPRVGETLARPPRGRGAGGRGAAGGGARGGAPAPTPITLGGVVYPHGIGTLSINELIVDLKGQATRFVSMVGLDDLARGEASVAVEVWVDDRKRFESGVLRPGDAPALVDIDVIGARFLELFIDDGGDTSNGDYADWGGALLYLRPGATTRPETWTFPSEPPPAIASGWPETPRINAPRITGGTPGRPFLFRVPATGAAPLAFEARGLPEGLTLDSSTGIITGRIAREGRTDVALTVTNARGRATGTLTIVGGTDALALTPPLGWNSWNVWGRTVDEGKVRAAADAMVASGLAAHGYQFVNIDDGWEGERDADGVLQPNEKFPDMPGLADAVHARGLKIGIYSSPGPRTCQGLPGSQGFEAIDARTWAAWGIDLLKYDWCSYGGTDPTQPVADLQKPFRVMREALDAVNRDIVYSLCQYGMGRVWEWGAEVGGNLWRTTGDLTDVWSNMAAVGFRQDDKVRWSKPGHWTDPDMLVIGKVGWGPNIHDTRLTPNEQITHISLWALQAAPLLIGADMAAFDRFTTDLMTNHEVIEVNQDVLGRAARRVYQRERLELWARPLADGTIAAGLFNRGLRAAEMTATWAELGLSGPRVVRNLWQQRDVGTFDDGFTVQVPAHGVVLFSVR
ncbi:MAG: NPCBM/NEW2 domain-containing protein [Vicinamibacterales bacterium]